MDQGDALSVFHDTALLCFAPLTISFLCVCVCVCVGFSRACMCLLACIQRRKHQHADAVRRQIEEQEKLKRREREDFFHEGKQLHEEAEARKRRLNEIKQRKLEELKSLGIDAKYVAPVERLIRAPTNSKKVTAPI